MKDNLEFINTHPNLVGFLMGLLISMEEKGENRDTIKGLKVALFGPIAGIGDAIFWFTLLPIMAGICSSFASQGNLLGPILFFAVYLLIFFLRVGWTHVGYSVGVKAIDKVRENSQMIARSATILGITVIGGLIASYVHINVVTSFAIDSTHSVALQQDFFDKVFPNILPMAYTLLMYYFLRVKKSASGAVNRRDFCALYCLFRIRHFVNGTRHCFWRCLFIRNFILCKPFSKLKTIRR